MPQLAIVAEDRLTQAVLQKCVRDYLPAYSVVRSEVKGGRGNVQRELQAYTSLAKVMPVLIGVDLDGDQCAPALLAAWGIGTPAPRSPIVRVAVREIETWVLADRRRTAGFLDAPLKRIPTNPELLPDPKRTLLELAREYASVELKGDLVPRNFAQYPRIGPAYNLRMCDFVDRRWRPHVAASTSQSLARAVRAIERLA